MSQSVTRSHAFIRFRFTFFFFISRRSLNGLTKFPPNPPVVFIWSSSRTDAKGKIPNLKRDSIFSKILRSTFISGLWETFPSH